MSGIDVLRADVAFDEPTLVEGLPGVGLVGKLAADHLVETFDMVHYANVHCEGLPPVTTYATGDRELATPVRLYADAARDLLVLQSDVPVSPGAALEFADCLGGWSVDAEVTALYLSGIGREREEGATPALYGVGTGDGGERLGAVDIDPPTEPGLITGPTGALLNHALHTDATAMGLVVEATPQFPDPEAAAHLLDAGIGPLLDAEIPVAELTEHAAEIRQAKRRLAERMQGAEETSSQARPLGMYQ
ncbi:proteasome assembly chaperone family protein [Haloplanus rubicundus]|uniref:Proteasome assembly chaperone family protein n=1 Tax=Haloplanus rubicundus TaxID=1547898 RepID=A0A345EF00_9EURY|nr:PAC2 family protein [Haloplanus rubicundus]AXG07356.1 proteasome assembly chaperone family protein [Haloplanus rubicundus]AXG10772.1 proteasome assembly chaperone family protein [Haloplanus rubicundus]